MNKKTEPVTCPKCGTENRPQAKFCDQCGVAFYRTAGFNWIAIVVIVLVIAAFAWLLFAPTKQPATQMAQASKAASGGDNPNPHSEMGMSNPHQEGGMGTSNPHQEGGMGMDELMPGFDDAKAKLDENPLDIQTLTYLYQMYGEVGMQSKITPYMEAAFAELEKPDSGLSDDEVLQYTRDIASAALAGADVKGAIIAFNRLNDLEPGNPMYFAALGDLYKSEGNTELALQSYNDALDLKDADVEPMVFWSVRYNRGELYADAGNSELAREDFQYCIDNAPDDASRDQAQEMLSGLD